ncbi:hypothetical protein SAMN04488030_0373 [Aliiroseovarius halocynthiae]|nr:hypothetical protein SAMN04488030_0373 [Aliiroseovarius halocynthiae]
MAVLVLKLLATGYVGHKPDSVSVRFVSRSFQFLDRQSDTQQKSFLFLYSSMLSRNILAE